MAKVMKKDTSRWCRRLAPWERRRLVSLIRKVGLTSAQEVFELQGNGYVSMVTLGKLAKEAGIELRQGRPSLKSVAKRSATVEKIAG